MRGMNSSVGREREGASGVGKETRGREGALPQLKEIPGRVAALSGTEQCVHMRSVRER